MRLVDKIGKAIEDEIEECLLDYHHVFIPEWAPNHTRSDEWKKDRKQVIERLAKAVMLELKTDGIV